MSSQAAVIKVSQSLIPLPPEAFPKNLSRTGREDAPESMFPILAYDGENILPTPWGYRSYFATNEKLLKDAVARLLVNTRCENIFWYQSVQLDNVLIALASDGIYITNSDIDTDWIKVVDLAAYDTDPAVRKQWSFCTINNITFMYLQGIPNFYALVDVARYAEAATPTVITGATVAQVVINWNVGVLRYTPTFLNMAGQLGIFKAGNRLGFWDSDTSVSWSSALYVEDFTPSVTTLAGFSKFSDVVGSITRICQHGDGFIIYCTRAIVGVTNNVNEKSKFSGRALLSNSGVLFDRQIAVAQPDSLHYALTSSGLYTITNFQPEVIATDIIDGLVEDNDYLALDYIDGRYLFINTLNGWKGSVIDFEGETNTDFDGNKYVFPAVNYPNPEDPTALLDSYLNGRNELIQDAFDEFEPIDSPAAVQEPGRALVPCFNIKTFESNWANTTFSPIKTGTELLDSKIKLGVTYLLDELYTEAVVTVNSITTDSNLPGNFAGQEAMDLINQGMNKFNNQIDYQNDWFAANQVPYLVDKFIPATGMDDPQEAVTEVWEKNLIERREYPFHLDSRDIKAEANKCRLHLYCDKTRLAEYLIYFEGVETFSPEFIAFSYGNDLIANELLALQQSTSFFSPKFLLRVKYTPALLEEFRIGYNIYVGYLAPGTQIINDGNDWYGYAEWVVIKYPDLVVEADGISIDDWTQALTSASDISGIPAEYALQGTDRYAHWYHAINGADFIPDPSSPTVINLGKYTGLIGGSPGEVSYSTVTTNPGSPARLITGTDTWSPAEIAEWRTTAKTSPGYRLQGVVSIERELLPNFAGKYTIYDMEISGFGYYPSGGFSFRKTHSRASSTSCPIPSASWGVSLPSGPDLEFPDYDINVDIQPPYKWEYPDSIALPPNYWLTKKGSASPLYPTFTRSLVYDTQLEKWGISNMAFKAICGISPVNRTDKTIAPKHDYGMLAAVLNVDGSISVIRPNNTQAQICYGKIGQYRLGRTRMAYLKCHFKDEFTGTLIVETSLDGRTVAKELTKAADFSGVLSALFPFTMVGDWFNIKIQGQFALSHIECYIEGRSRR